MRQQFSDLTLPGSTRELAKTKMAGSQPQSLGWESKNLHFNGFWGYWFC